jgi:hypothetical protein
MGLVKTRSWGKGDGIISGKEIGENAYQILLPVDRDDDDFVLPKHSQKRSERESFVPSRDKGKARETGVPSGKTMRVRAFGQSIAYPGARHVKLIAQRSQDGRKESVVLHTVPTESALDNLVEQGFGVEGEGAVPGVLYAVQSERKILPSDHAKAANCKGPGVSLGLTCNATLPQGLKAICRS